jgi:hypothetical protein
VTDAFYHLDRRTELAPGDVLGLEAVDAPDDAPLAALYPGGVTNHGRHYVEQGLHEADAEDLWDVSCELLFELVRVARYPERPSRLQSVFGFEARRDVRRFVETYVDPPYTVWRVTAEESFTSDMKLVDVEDVAHGLGRADRYWRGRTDVDRPLREALLVPPVEVVDRVEALSAE